MFKINPKKLNFDQKIFSSSSSSSGDIFAYQNNEYDDAWMMKKINVDNDFNNLLQRVQEIVLGFNQSHHNILPISGYDIQYLKSGGWEIYLRLQRMKASLKDVLIEFKNKDQGVPESEILKYFHEAASGLEYLHNQKIAHRNVTLQNAFLDKDGNVRLANFNLAAIVSDEEEFYLSQEENGESQRQPIEGRNLLKNDVWCLGKMILELCLLSEDLVIEESDKVGISQMFKQLEEKYSKNLAKLLMKMLTFNLAKRISIHEVTQILQNRLNKEAERSMMIDSQYFGEDSMWAESTGELPNLEASMSFLKEALNNKWIEDFRIDLNEPSTVLSISNKQSTTDQVITEFSEDLESMIKQKHLEGFKQLFFSCREGKKLGDEGLINFSSSIGSCFTQLNHLVLDFSWGKQITDKGLISLVTNMNQTLRNLDHLSLDFRGCVHVGDKGLIVLASHIGTKLTMLKHLMLNFRGCPLITDKGINYLSTHIGIKFTNLTELIVDFEWCKVSDLAIMNLATEISTNLVNLQHISINEKTLDNYLQKSPGNNCNIF